MIPVNSIVHGAMPKPTKWHNCYEGGWQGIIVPEAFSHPAKMSYALLKRILAHAKEQTWLKQGDIIVDPFGGIGSTGILGAYEGCRVVCVELEEKFVKLAKENFDLHWNVWMEFGNPEPVILRGDSRRLCEIVEKADCIVSSPPYSTEQMGGGGTKHDKNIDGMKEGYGKTPGQLSAMKPGNVDMVVSSPPYAKSNVTGKANSYPGSHGPHSQVQIPDYRQSKENLGNLNSGDVDCVISSPPWEQTNSKFSSNTGVRQAIRDWANKEVSYGKTKGQIGNRQGETFWSAAKVIVGQCHQILKPGGHAIWVVKSFVRKGKIVDFPGDWQRLCESVGFKTVCIHHAMLYKEPATLLMDWAKKKRTERVSFFRRNANNKAAWRNYWKTLREETHGKWLAKAKQKLPKGKLGTILQKAQQLAFIDAGEVHWDWNDDVRIDYEVVLCMQKAGRNSG